jgi:hypothetical protein
MRPIPAQVRRAAEESACWTSTQLLNMFRLVSDVAAQEVVDGAFFDVTQRLQSPFSPCGHGTVQEHSRLHDADLFRRGRAQGRRIRAG